MSCTIYILLLPREGFVLVNIEAVRKDPLAMLLANQVSTM
jgi:hypothetical protein